MAKIEFTPISDWQKFNFLGKRLFDFINLKLNATTGIYTGNGLAGKAIFIDIIAKCIIVFKATNDVPVIWIDTITSPLSKDFAGNNLPDGILGLSARKDSFILGNNPLVNQDGIPYYYIVFGS